MRLLPFDDRYDVTGGRCDARPSGAKNPLPDACLDALAYDDGGRDEPDCAA